MPTIPDRLATRITTGLKRFQPILAAAQAKDINESDTVVLVTDILSEVLGYEKYEDISSEHSIRGTFCDLAIKVEGELAMLIEVKAIGANLREQHVKQAIDYAANKGCEWAVLTNGLSWRVYRVLFEKPIDKDLVADFCVADLNPKKADDIELLWMLSKEGWQRSRLEEFAAQREALSRFTIGAILMADPCLAVVRRELRRVSPDASVTTEQIRTVLENEVVKRDVLDGDKATSARRLVSRSASRALRETGDHETSTPGANEAQSGAPA